MTTTKTTEALIIEIVEALAPRRGEWVRIAELAEALGMTGTEFAEAVGGLGDDFDIEPEPFGHRVTVADRRYGPVIGGEQHHLIRWNA